MNTGIMTPVLGGARGYAGKASFRAPFPKMEEQMQFELYIPPACPKDMPEATAEVLRQLHEAGARGITWDDFPRGFALRSRISDLRNKRGYRITTINESLPGGCQRARYVLLS